MDDAVRAQIRELLETGLPTEHVARQLGVPRGTVSAVKAHITMGSYHRSSPGAGSLSEADVEEIEDAANLKFGLERDLQDALRRNIHHQGAWALAAWLLLFGAVFTYWCRRGPKKPPAWFSKPGEQNRSRRSGPTV